MDTDNKTNNEPSATDKKSCSHKSFFECLKNLFSCKKKTLQEDKKIREDLTEKKIDKMVKDSFPASDPPSTY